MKNSVGVECSVCGFQYSVDWDSILDSNEKGLRLGDYIYMGVCPQCRVLHRGQIIEDMRGKK